MDEPTDALIGRVVGSRYRLEARLGSGAMGAVYRARHVKMNRAFAVKILHVELLEEPKVLKRFQREAELAGTLSHSNIVNVVDVGETFEGLQYIAMEYADGPTLGEIVTKDAPMPADRVIAIISQICDGLHHAHESGLVHRDLKPDNIIVENNRDGREVPRIVDFGIAVVRDDASKAQRERLTTAGITLGTPHYMAPEHVTGQAIDHRIDLFALGVIAYEMLSGVMPFTGDGVDVARANLLEETPYMASRAPGVEVDPLLEAFVRKLLSKSPDARPATARAARELLDLIKTSRPRAAAALGIRLSDVPPVTPPPIPPPPAPRYATFTPPTPFLAIPHPIEYSPSGQHAIVQAPRDSGAIPVYVEPSPSARMRVVRGSQPSIAWSPSGADPGAPPGVPSVLPPPVSPMPVRPVLSALPVRKARAWLPLLVAVIAALALGGTLAVLLSR